MNTPLNLQLLRLSTLLQLEHRARRAGVAELGFLIVNDTATVVSYQQAALWRQGEDGGRLAAISGGATVDPAAPYSTWLRDVLRALARDSRTTTMHDVAAGDLPKRLAGGWAEWFPTCALWCPLMAGERLLGGVLIGRQEPWRDADHLVLEPLISTYGQCLLVAHLTRTRRFRLPRRRIALALAGLGLLAALGMLPVRQSVIAPAEIVPINPVPIRAPFEGIVNAIEVAPNAAVRAGDHLLALDKRELDSKRQIARKELEIAREEYSMASQQALLDPKSKARLAILQARIDQHMTELTYSESMLDRAEVTAPIDGIAVFTDPHEWIGRPVATGERIMQLWSPDDAQLEIQVPVGDVVSFDVGAQVLLFRNIMPDRPIPARVTFASYGAAMTPEGVLAYVLRARLIDAPADFRLGERGTAKIYGPRQALALFLLRKPLAKLREWLWL